MHHRLHALQCNVWVHQINMHAILHFILVFPSMTIDNKESLADRLKFPATEVCAQVKLTIVYCAAMKQFDPFAR